MTRAELRRVLYNNCQAVRRLALTKRQVELIVYATRCQVDAPSTASAFGLSLQNASQQLAKLYRKGYLTRDELVHPTGGYFYEYTAAPEVTPDDRN